MRTTRKTRRQYNVYHAPDGGSVTYLGQATSLRAARALVARTPHGGGLPECLWATARAAGHCAGMRAPDQQGEASEPTAWFGRRGEYCAVRVIATRTGS